MHAHISESQKPPAVPPIVMVMVFTPLVPAGLFRPKIYTFTVPALLLLFDVPPDAVALELVVPLPVMVLIAPEAAALAILIFKAFPEPSVAVTVAVSFWSMAYKLKSMWEATVSKVSVIVPLP